MVKQIGDTFQSHTLQKPYRQEGKRNEGGGHANRYEQQMEGKSFTMTSKKNKHGRGLISLPLHSTPVGSICSLN